MWGSRKIGGQEQTGRVKSSRRLPFRLSLGRNSMQAPALCAAIAATLACGAMLSVSGCAKPSRPKLSLPLTPELVLRGQELVTGLGACGRCHGSQPLPVAILSGGIEVEDSFGKLKSPNITPAASGIKGWTVDDMFGVFRRLTAPTDPVNSNEKRQISAEVHTGSEWLSDGDLLALTAYLWSLPPVENKVESRDVSLLERNTVGLTVSRPVVTGYVPDLSKSHPLQRGQYLADHVARCGTCHNSPSDALNGGRYLSGGQRIVLGSATAVAPNITTSRGLGIGSWKDSDIVKYLQTGVTPAGRKVDTRLCPVPFYRNAPNEELMNIATFLKTVPET